MAINEQERKKFTTSLGITAFIGEDAAILGSEIRVHRETVFCGGTINPPAKPPTDGRHAVLVSGKNITFRRGEFLANRVALEDVRSGWQSKAQVKQKAASTGYLAGPGEFLPGKFQDGKTGYSLVSANVRGGPVG